MNKMSILFIILFLVAVSIPLTAANQSCTDIVKVMGTDNVENTQSRMQATVDQMNAQGYRLIAVAATGYDGVMVFEQCPTQAASEFSNMTILAIAAMALTAVILQKRKPKKATS